MSANRMPVLEQRLTVPRYDAMCQAIMECHRVDEVKDLRDKAKALEVYARQAQNHEAERKAAEIRIRAERRAGQLLREMKQTGQRHNGKGNNPSKLASSSSSPTQLKDLGINWDQSSKWQLLANVPEEEFENAINGTGPIPTTEGVINANVLRKTRQPRMDPDSLWLWGRLRDFERHGLLRRDASDILNAMTDSMRDDCIRIVPRVVVWLKEMT